MHDNLPKSYLTKSKSLALRKRRIIVTSETSHAVLSCVIFSKHFLSLFKRTSRDNESQVLFKNSTAKLQFVLQLEFALLRHQNHQITIINRRLISTLISRITFNILLNILGTKSLLKRQVIIHQHPSPLHINYEINKARAKAHVLQICHQAAISRVPFRYFGAALIFLPLQTLIYFLECPFVKMI